MYSETETTIARAKSSHWKMFAQQNSIFRNSYIAIVKQFACVLRVVCICECESEC